jgi:hypothetical protein
MPERRRTLLSALALCLAFGSFIALPARSAGLEIIPVFQETAPEPTGTTGYPAPETPIPEDTPAPQPEAVVRAVEPRRIPRETGGRLSIYGEGFGPGAVVRLVGYGLLDTMVVNSTALQAVVPPGLPENRFDLEVILADGRVIRAEESVRITAEDPTPTTTTAALTGYMQPQVLVQSARTEPAALRPGEPFDLVLEIANRGDYAAAQVRVAVNDSSMAAPRGGSNLAVVDLLSAGQAVSVELSLALSENAAAGYNNLEIMLQYLDYYGREYTSSQNIGLEVGGQSDQPIVLLESYRTEPEALVAGDEFLLVLKLSNVGRYRATDLLLTLGGQEGAGSQPFALVGSGNVKFIASLAPGDAATLEQRFVLDGSAEPGLYSLPVSLSYTGSDGAVRIETQTLSLQATRRPQLRIGFYRPVEPGQVGLPMELPVELVNIGRDLVNVSTIELGAEDADIEEGMAFIGALDAGTSGSLDARVTPRKAGSLSLQLTVHYLDDFNHPREVIESLVVEVEAPPTPEPDDQAGAESGGLGGFWETALKILRGLLGLGS